MAKKPEIFVEPLIEEHKTILKMLEFLKKWKDYTNLKKREIIVDFFNTYVALCHNGKEEKIFFKLLQTKPLSDSHKKMLKELLQEHKQARIFIREFSACSEKEIKEILQKIIHHYTEHIDKENNRFFLPALEYLSSSERESMLKEFNDFDRNMIHCVYSQVVEDLLKKG